MFNWAAGADKLLRPGRSQRARTSPLIRRPSLRRLGRWRNTRGFPSCHEASLRGRLPVPARVQLSGLGSRGLRLQHRHLGAADRPGLAGVHPTHRSRRVGGRPGHGPAIRTAAPAVALDRRRRRPFRPAQAPHRHPGDHGQSRPDPGAPDRHRRRRALARLHLRLPVRQRRRLRCAGAPDFRRGTGRRCRPAQCRGSTRPRSTPPA